MKLDLFEDIKNSFYQKENPGVYRGISFYPSAPMSIDLTSPEKRIGACQRAEYYRCKRVPQTDPIPPYSMYIMDFGKELERWLIEKVKTLGIYAGSNIKFQYPNKPLISGEIDILIKPPGSERYKVIENKTYSSSNYAAKKSICGAGGRKPQVPKPKDNNLMQSFIYLHALENVDEVLLTYVDRAAGDPENHVQFDITNTVIDNKNYPKVNVKRPFGEFEYVYEKCNIESILEGYDHLLSYLKADTLPPRSYKLEMSKEEVEQGYENGDVSKTKYELFLKDPEKNKVSDWQCAWCQYNQQCKADG